MAVSFTEYLQKRVIALKKQLCDAGMIPVIPVETPDAKCFSFTLIDLTKCGRCRGPFHFGDCPKDPPLVEEKKPRDDIADRLARLEELVKTLVVQKKVAQQETN